MKPTGKIGHDELYTLLTSREVSWQAIIYDLIQSEQLDPWDIDLTKLTRAYLEKIKELEEASFLISSKILLAAAILLRIKSEYLIDKYIKELDDILFGKPEEKKKAPFTFELEDVDLFPKTPMPRLRKVTLPELMASLNRAMETEHRRIKREIILRQSFRDASMNIPKFTFNIREKIQEIYTKIIEHFKSIESGKMTFSQLTNNSQVKTEKISVFLPLLHLDHQGKVNLEQENHFEEIYISLMKPNQENKETVNVNSDLKSLEEKEENI